MILWHAAVILSRCMQVALPSDACKKIHERGAGLEKTGIGVNVLTGGIDASAPWCRSL